MLQLGGKQYETRTRNSKAETEKLKRIKNENSNC